MAIEEELNRELWMELARLQFDRSLARAYRKVSRVLAFRSDDAFVFHKPWGVQHSPEGSWIIVPLLDDGVTGDVYGCHREAFVATYQAAPDSSPHCYEKHAIVYAYQPGEPFAVTTEISGFKETNPATGGATDWVVQNPLKEVYIISDSYFRQNYRPEAEGFRNSTALQAADLTVPTPKATNPHGLSRTSDGDAEAGLSAGARPRSARPGR